MDEETNGSWTFTTMANGRSRRGIAIPPKFSLNLNVVDLSKTAFGMPLQLEIMRLRCSDE